MKKINPKHDIFIREMLLHGNRVRAYLAAYPGAGLSSAASRACTLLKQPAITQKLEEEQNRILDRNGSVQAGILQEKLESVAGMRQLLVAIISGEFTTQKTYKMKDTIETIELKASISEALSALNINLRMMKTFKEEELPPILNVYVGKRKEE